jgi:voltage-dependent anion channel protein 2
MPAKSTYGGKLNLHYKQPNVHVRSFIDLFKGPVATVDLTLGHEGFLVGAEGGYDVQKAAMTKYSLAAGYSQGSYAAAITATNNLSIFSASYYHKVNAEVEAGAKATWDSAAGSNVGLEVASKYKLDPSSFAKVRHPPFSLLRPHEIGRKSSRSLADSFLSLVQAKINDRGIAALAYNVKLSTGVTLGLGASFDTQNLSQAAHKVGASFTFEG